MKKSKHSVRIAVMLLSVVLLLTLFPGIGLSASAAEYDTEDAVTIEFTDSGIEASGGDSSGYEIDGTELKISGSGTYILTGSCTGGSVKVEKGTKDVKLVLNGLTLSGGDTAAIICGKSSEVIIIAAEGTVNSLSDTEKNNDESYPDNENAENAVIKCKDGSDVTISGTGELNITANGKNGIKSGASTDEEGEASLTIKEVTLNIEAPVNDGINAEALIDIESGSITVAAGDDGIHSDYVLNIGSESAEGPKINITECYEGLEAAELNVYSGDISITASDDCMNAANSELTGYDFSLNIFGGTLYMYTDSGDGIDSNGSLTISGGTIEVWSGSVADNQPLDADGEITINGGTVFAAGGSAGMGMDLTGAQSAVIFGSSAMGGGMNGVPQNGGEMTGAPQNVGGTGETPPEKPDGDGSANTGGGQSMPEMPGDMGEREAPDMPESGAPAGGMAPGGQNTDIQAGSTVQVRDSSGNVLYEAEAPCGIGYVVFSSGDLTAEGEYTLCADGEEVYTASSSDGTAAPADVRGDTAAPDTETEDTAAKAETKSETNTVVYIIAAAVVIATGVTVTVVYIKKRKNK